MSGTSTLKSFQSHVWNSLPVRRTVIGREVVDDFVSAAIQLWPVTELCQVGKDDAARLQVLYHLALDVKRILDVVYGDDRFNAYWKLGMNSMSLLILEVIDDWWVRRKDNRAKLILWRRKWTSSDE